MDFVVDMNIWRFDCENYVKWLFFIFGLVVELFENVCATF